MTLGNFLLYKSQVKKSLYQNALSSMFEVKRILFVLLRKKRNIILNVLDRTKITTHWEEVKTIVWYTTPKMKDKKYFMHYKMSFDVLII